MLKNMKKLVVVLERCDASQGGSIALTATESTKVEDGITAQHVTVSSCNALITDDVTNTENSLTDKSNDGNENENSVKTLADQPDEEKLVSSSGEMFNVSDDLMLFDLLASLQGDDIGVFMSKDVDLLVPPDILPDWPDRSLLNMSFSSEKGSGHNFMPFDIQVDGLESVHTNPSMLLDGLFPDEYPVTGLHNDVMLGGLRQSGGILDDEDMLITNVNDSLSGTNVVAVPAIGVDFNNSDFVIDEEDWKCEQTWNLVDQSCSEIQTCQSSSEFDVFNEEFNQRMKEEFLARRLRCSTRLQTVQRTRKKSQNSTEEEQNERVTRQSGRRRGSNGGASNKNEDCSQEETNGEITGSKVESKRQNKRRKISNEEKSEKESNESDEKVSDQDKKSQARNGRDFFSNFLTSLKSKKAKFYFDSEEEETEAGISLEKRKVGARNESGRTSTSNSEVELEQKAAKSSLRSKKKIVYLDSVDDETQPSNTDNNNSGCDQDVGLDRELNPCKDSKLEINCTLNSLDVAEKEEGSTNSNKKNTVCDRSGTKARETRNLFHKMGLNNFNSGETLQFDSTENEAQLPESCGDDPSEMLLEAGETNNLLENPSATIDCPMPSSKVDRLIDENVKACELDTDSVVAEKKKRPKYKDISNNMEVEVDPQTLKLLFRSKTLKVSLNSIAVETDQQLQKCVGENSKKKRKSNTKVRKSQSLSSNVGVDIDSQALRPSASEADVCPQSTNEDVKVSEPGEGLNEDAEVQMSGGDSTEDAQVRKIGTSNKNLKRKKVEDDVDEELPLRKLRGSVDGTLMKMPDNMDEEIQTRMSERRSDDGNRRKKFKRDSDELDETKEPEESSEKETEPDIDDKKVDRPKVKEEQNQIRKETDIDRKKLKSSKVSLENMDVVKKKSESQKKGKEPVEARENVVKKSKKKLGIHERCRGPGCSSRIAVDSVYCSDDCIEGHVEESIKLLRKERLKEYSKSAMQSDCNRPLDRIVVFERKSGKLVTGPLAPTEATLLSWLQRHRTYEVLQPKSSTEPKSRPLSESRNRPLDVRKKISDNREIYTSAAEKSRQSQKTKPIEKKELHKLIEKSGGQKPELAAKEKTKTSSGLDSFRLCIRSDIRQSLLIRLNEDVLVSTAEVKQLAIDIENELHRYCKGMNSKYKDESQQLLELLKKSTSSKDDVAYQALCGTISPLKLIQLLSDRTSCDITNILSSSIFVDTTDRHGQHVFDVSCRICMGTSETTAVQPAPSLSISEGNVASSALDRQLQSPIMVTSTTDIELVSSSNRDKPETSEANDLSSETSKVSSTFSSFRKLDDRIANLTSSRTVSMLDSFNALITQNFTSDAQSAVIKERSERSCSDTMIDVVWSGCLYAKELASINLCAFRTSGSMKILRSVLPRTINIMGRISPKVIEDYLMKIKTTFSTSKEVSVICFHCDNDEQRPNYKALFNYFNDRKRCGVVGTFGSAIKDMYIWPLPASAPLPSILLPFNGPGLDIYRTDLLLGIVVQKAQLQKQPGLQPGAPSAGSHAPSSAPTDPRRMSNNAEPVSSANKLVSDPVDIPLTNESEVTEESSDEDNSESSGEARKDPIVSKFSKREKKELLPAPVQVKKLVDDDAPYDPEVAAAEVPYDPELSCSYDPSGSADTSFSVPETDISDDMSAPYDPEALLHHADDDETLLKESELSDSMVGTAAEQTADENKQTFETIGSSNGSKTDNDGVEELHPENTSGALVPSEQFQIMHDSRSEVTSVGENVEKKTIQDLHMKQYLNNFSLILRQVSKSTNLEPCIMSGLLEGLTSMAGMSEYSDVQKILLKQLADVIKKQGSMNAEDCSRSDENSSDLAKTYAIPPKSMNETSLVPSTSVNNNHNLVNEPPQECHNNRTGQVTGSSNNWAGTEGQYTVKDNCTPGIPLGVASYKTTNISFESETSRCSDINLKQILPVVNSILPQMSFESLRNILKSTIAPKPIRDVTPCVATTGDVMGVLSSCLPSSSMDVDYRQNGNPASHKTGSLRSHNSEMDNNLLSNNLNSVLMAPPRPPEILLKGGPTCFRAVLPPPPLPPSCLRLPRHEFPLRQSRPEFINRSGANTMQNPFAPNTVPIPLAPNRLPSSMVKNPSNNDAVPSSLGDPASHQRENFEKQIRERMAMTSMGFERLKMRPPLLPSPGLGVIQPGAPLFIPGHLSIPPKRLGLPYGPPSESEMNRTCSNVGDRLAAGRKDVADHTVKSTCGDLRFQEPGSFWNKREIREPPMQRHDTMSIDSIMPVLDYGHKSQSERIFKNETENFRDFNKETSGNEDCPAGEKRHGTHRHHNKDHHRGHSEDKRSHRDEKVRPHGDERERSRSSRSKSRSKSGKRSDVRESSLDQQKTHYSPYKSPHKSDGNRKRCDGSPRGRTNERREQNKYNSPRRRSDDRRKDSESPHDKNAVRHEKNKYSSPRRSSRERKKDSESPRGRNFVQQEKDKHESDRRSRDRRKEDDISRNVDRHGKINRDTRNGDSSRRKNENNDKNAGSKFEKKADAERPIGTRCDDVIIIDELEGGQSKAVEGESSTDEPLRSCGQMKNGEEEVVEHQENEDALVIVEEGEIIADTDDPPCE